MALTVNRADLFPAGTSVGAYLGAGSSREGKPTGSAVETQTASGSGSLTFSALTDGKRYTLYALVGGQHRRLLVHPSPTFVAQLPWKSRLAARRAAIGTS